MSEARREDYWGDLADQADRDDEQANARFYGMKGEEYAVERFGLIKYETGHSDLLIPYEHHFTDREPPMSGYDTRRHPGNRRKIQCKGARLKVKRGDGGRAGRFRLWDSDHEKLVRDNALYLFLGYDPGEREPVECVRFIPARELDEAVGGLNWYDAEHSTKNGRPTDLSVRTVFPDL